MAIINDQYFRVGVLAATPNPQQLCWIAAHQDYCEDFVCDFPGDFPSEEDSGDRIVRLLLKGDKGHFGAMEHQFITFNVGWFPHSVMQQARTHRVAVSFDVQSSRYTGKRFTDVADGKRNPEEVMYLRPVGSYADRQGDRYFYTEEMRSKHLAKCVRLMREYREDVKDGLSEEHARGLNVFEFRQHFIVSFNMRSLMHFLDMRAKKDAQPEIQAMCELLFVEFELWVPAIAAWYKKERWAKAKLAP